MYILLSLYWGREIVSVLSSMDKLLVRFYAAVLQKKEPCHNAEPADKFDIT